MGILLVSIFAYIVVVASAVYFAVTQVFLPISRGENLFPWFRKTQTKRKEVLKTKAELNDLKEMFNLEQELQDLHKRINQYKQTNDD